MAISGKTGWIVLGSVFVVAVVTTAVVVINFARDTLGEFKGVLKETFELPPDLQPYESAASVRAMLTAIDSVHDPIEPLDSHAVALFVASLDSSAIGVEMERAADGALKRDPSLTKGPLNMFGDAVKADIRREAITRRAMVRFLNANGISLERYRRMKLRSLAAAGITRAAADSALGVSRYSAQTARDPGDVDRAISAMDELFANVDSVRQSITASEVQLVARHRQRILDNAVPDLERMFPYF